jgi:hypothetical protein
MKLEQRSEVVIGRFADTLPKVLERAGHVDFAYVDGHYDASATLQYFEQLKPHLRSKSVVTFGGVHWSAGMDAAWKQIIADPAIGIAIDLFTMGLCTLTGPGKAFRIGV